MKLNLFSRLLLAALLAFTVNSFIYFSFGNIYSSKILNYAGFSHQFQSGIYQYRILSAYFLIWIYDVLSGLNIDYQLLKLHFLREDAEAQMYLSFYILNTIFLVFSAVMMVLISDFKNFIATPSEKILLIAVTVFVLAFSQFVIVPYDVSSYFLMLLFFYVLMKYLKNNSPLNLILLLLILIISTLNRESSALSLSLAATLLFVKFGTTKKTIIPILALAAGFVAVYLGMRLFHDSFSTNDGNLLRENFTQPKNILGLLFWVVFFVFTLVIAKDHRAVHLILLFHLLSLPYILMCFYSGIVYEIRLYVPLFLTSLLLGRLEVQKNSLI